jgi:hypothetical protein
MTRRRHGSRWEGCWWESPDPQKLYYFSPLKADGSPERQHMMINEVDLVKLNRRSKSTTVFDLWTPKIYAVQRAGNDHRLLVEEVAG